MDLPSYDQLLANLLKICVTKYRKKKINLIANIYLIKFYSYFYQIFGKCMYKVVS